ncbi:MAG: tRNA dihydrouridine synthase DusB [Gammaproteobacteria bacterium]|nr:tRNA dihydrouridine synthase DusB [Gammaproteobacteria bacterium]
MKIGPYQLESPVILAPMAGITDQPFRQLCRQLGAGLAVSEMVSSNPDLRNSRKTQLRLNHKDESAPISVQIAGTEALQMAEAARYNADKGAQIIDINMGCPAKKVCNVAAGSALLKDEKLVADILHRVVNAVNIPVTLKIRTGWDKTNKNAINIAKIAQDSGIQALTIHGRTRECAFKGDVEYDTIAEVKSRIHIPVIANGDIDSPEKAKQVLEFTNADAIMVGRAAQGRPWIFREINYFLETGKMLAPPGIDEISELLQNHLKQLYAFYGDYMGLRIARKHINWYCRTQQEAEIFRKRINRVENPAQQLADVVAFFQKQKKLMIAA